MVKKKAIIAEIDDLEEIKKDEWEDEKEDEEVKEKKLKEKKEIEDNIEVEEDFTVFDYDES